MRAVVTGGRGFIGSRLLLALRAAGWDTLGIDVLPGPGVEVIDVLDTSATAAAFQGAEVVVHTAARVGEQGGGELFFRVNVEGTHSVLAAARRSGVGRFVHLSSIVVHGRSFPDGVTEDAPVRPTGNPYTDTKIASEHAVLRAGAAGQPVVVLRPGDVYGPGSVPWSIRPVQMMASGRFALIDGGRGVLSPVYVDDLVAGIVSACSADAARGEVIHLSAAAGVPAAEYFGRYAALTGTQLRSVPTALVRGLDPVARLARRLGRELPISARTLEYLTHPGSYSIAKAQRLLDWTPTTPLEDGVAMTFEWLRREGIFHPATA